MFGDDGCRFAVQLSKVTVTDQDGEHPQDDEVSFLICKGERLLRADGQPVAVTMSKVEAKELAHHLLNLIGEY